MNNLEFADTMAAGTVAVIVSFGVPPLLDVADGVNGVHAPLSVVEY